MPRRKQSSTTRAIQWMLVEVRKLGEAKLLPWGASKPHATHTGGSRRSYFANLLEKNEIGSAINLRRANAGWRLVGIAGLLLVSACIPKDPQPARNNAEFAPYEQAGATTAELKIALLTENAGHPEICERVTAYLLPDITYYNTYVEAAREQGFWWKFTDRHMDCDAKAKLYREANLPAGSYNAVVIYEDMVPGKYAAGYSLDYCKGYVKSVMIPEEGSISIDMDKNSEEITMRGCDPFNFF